MSTSVITKLQNLNIDEDDYQYAIDSESDGEIEEYKEYKEDRDKDLSVEDPNIIPNCKYWVLSIDVGVRHLGISVSALDSDYNLLEIIWIDLIDITEFIHNFGTEKKHCKLYHEKTFCDWLEHTFQENQHFFDQADYVLIERQPPMGFVVVEQLIFSKFRDKAILIHPSSMHKYFSMGDLDYDQRKDRVTKIAKMKIQDPILLEQIDYYDRPHDIADSICIMLFWANKTQKLHLEEKRKREIMTRRMSSKLKVGVNISIEDWFENHKYIPAI